MKAPRLRPAAEKVAYRVAGLPVAARGLVEHTKRDPLRAIFTQSYWRPRNASEACQLTMALIVWPVVVLLGSAWYTYCNGSVIRARYGKSIAVQFAEQIRLYFTAGVLAPWYYIFSLYEEPDRASEYLQRFESKSFYIPMLKGKKGSPLNDKVQFAKYCAERQIRCVETLLHLDGRPPSQPMPECDLFVKPNAGRGGRGAERWDLIAPQLFANPEGRQLSGEALFARLVERSQQRELVVQPRLRPHPALSNLTTGALPTIRVLTTLDEQGQPEIMAAVFRTSIGQNRTVDNLHAGGIAALVDLESGLLSKSSNLGADAQLGWTSTHPDTGAPVEGIAIPCWPGVKALAIAAHRKFTDRVIIGWDVAIVVDGAILIEGNGNPDLDIVQRFMRAGLKQHRFAQLIELHLQRATRQSHTCPTVQSERMPTIARDSFGRSLTPTHEH